MRPVLALAMLSIMASGCTATNAEAGPRNTASTLPPPPPSSGTFDTRGLETILNKRDDELVALFGVPRLDIIEGQARKLQFTNERCALDIYLYPPQNNAGSERRSNYAEARDRDGNAADPRACINDLRL